MHRSKLLFLTLCVSILLIPYTVRADTDRADRCATPVTTGSGQAHTVKVDGHPIALWSKSPENPKATLLLVHGRTWSGQPDFDLATDCEDLSLMNGLLAFGIETWAVDMRGYGKTPRDASGWLTPDRAAADVAAVLKWLEERPQQSGVSPQKPHLFGWSYGATMAQLAVQKFPNAAQSLSLFGYAVRKGYSTTPASLPQNPPRKANTHANAISDFIVPNSISRGAINAFAAKALSADPVRADWNELEQWKYLDGRLVAIPTLLLQGEFDPLTRKRVHRKLFRRLPDPNKKWVVIKGGDHAAFMESPRAEFISELAGFVLANNSTRLDTQELNTRQRETP